MTKYDDVNGGFKNEASEAGEPDIEGAPSFDRLGYYGEKQVTVRMQMNLAIATNLSYDWIRENWEPIQIILKWRDSELSRATRP